MDPATVLMLEYGAILVVLIIATVLRYYGPENHEDEEGDDFDDILPICRSKKRVKLTGDQAKEQCAICLDAFGDRKVVLLSHCKHMFHPPCIVEWTRRRPSCPLCRSAIGRVVETRIVIVVE